MFALAKALVSFGLLAWLLHKAGLGPLATVALHAHWQWLAVGVLLGFLSTCVQTSQWRALLRTLKLRRRWPRCLRLVFVGNTFNTVLPSSIGGDIMRAAMMAEHPSERVRALASVLLQRLCNFPGMILIMCVGVILTFGAPVADRIRPLALAGAVVGVVGLAICTTPLLGWLAQRRLLQRIRVARVLGELHDFRGERRQLLLASLRGTLFWGLSVLNQWCLMHAVGIDISLTYAAAVTTTVNAITMLPISINGYGVRESGFVTFLTVPGLATSSVALAASLCITAQSILWGLIGIPCLLIGSRNRIANAPLRVAESI